MQEVENNKAQQFATAGALPHFGEVNTNVCFSLQSDNF